MLEEFLKRVPTWLIGVALILFAIIAVWQRFVLDLPLYDGKGNILPSKSQLEAEFNRQGDAFDELAKRITAIEESPIVSLQAGAITIFDRPQGCPNGWADVGKDEAERFAGRTVIAAGSHSNRIDRGYGDRGGLESVQLKTANCRTRV
jgi:hypothetical protein